MEDETEYAVEPDLCCQVCGEKEFNLRAGYYYCQECGTKHEHVRAIEVEQEGEFNDSKFAKKQKIRVLKTEKPELTSWECYNYILRGFVEELLSMGAKEELKLMTLQVWAAYLRRMEVAFFNKKHAELPKLGVRFLKSDARTLYNHSQELRKKRKRKRADDSSVASATSSGRAWRKSLRKLDESMYSQHSASQTDTSGGPLSLSQTSMDSSSTGTTGRAIQLKFSSKARKHLKRIMPTKHLVKHELDAESKLSCHDIKPKVRSLNRMEHAVNTMSIKQLYAILGIALNLIEDDIQLSDLVRFIGEGHLSSRNVLQYFPENVAANGKQLLRDINFYLYPDKYPDKVLREHICLLAKCIGINEFKKPDIYKLALRYITELNLPADLAAFVERLINLLPPQLQTRIPHAYPPYEARAMAYVVFVLKLLFGLDGYKEQRMSTSAQHINRRMHQFSADKQSTSTRCTTHPTLFVWREWVEYVEMRKVILSQQNSNFCRQFKQPQSITQLLQDRREEQERLSEQEMLHGSGTDAPTNKVANMQRIFAKFQHDSCEAQSSLASQLHEARVFQPSLTPGHTYFKRLLLHGVDAHIPHELMRVDHAQRTLQPYLSAKKLRSYFSANACRLHVLPIGCTSKRSYVGVFRTPADNTSGPARQLRAERADFDISEEQWLRELQPEPMPEELEFKTQLDHYEKGYMKKLEARAQKRAQRGPLDNPDWLVSHQQKQWRQLNEQQNAAAAEEQESAVVSLHINSAVVCGKIRGTRVQGDNSDVLSMHSIDVFHEGDMEPISNLRLDAPRRQLDAAQLFAQLSDDDDDEEEEKGQHTNETQLDPDAVGEQHVENTEPKDGAKMTLVTSHMDCWMLLGSVVALNEIQKKVLENKFPRSFLWLLETCAQTIGVDWSVLYEQLLAIELMFGYGIENLDNFEDCIHFKYNNPIKDFNVLINSYREIW